MLTITAAQAGQRIDNFLVAQLKGVPKTRIYRAIRKGEVRVNRGRINATYRLKTGDQVRIPPIRVAQRQTRWVGDDLKRQVIENILYEDERFIVINKPAGLSVHGGSGVAVGLIDVLKNVRPDENLFLVHRLDRDTSGCLLVAKNRHALLALQEKMQRRDIEKQYVLLVHGHWPSGLDITEYPLLKKTMGGERMVFVDAAGKHAETRFKVLQYLKGITLLQATLVTGRMHQIRVHAAHAGYPIVGDRKYGDAEKDRFLFKKISDRRLFLHAKRLSFADFDCEGQKITITAPGFCIDELTETN